MNLPPKPNYFDTNLTRIVLGWNSVPITLWKKQKSEIRMNALKQSNETTQVVYVENLKEAKPQEFANTKQDHYREDVHQCVTKKK